MNSTLRNEYEPDYVTPPGEFLEEKLGEMGMSQAELAGRIGRTKKLVNEIIRGKAPLLPETAIQLERALAIPARFWTNAEANYRAFEAREEETRRLDGQRSWLKRLPIAKLVKLGWLPKRGSAADTLRDTLNYFGVASMEALAEAKENKRVSLRQSTAREVDEFALLAWLRKGELEAQKIKCGAFDGERFREALRQSRGLCRDRVTAEVWRRAQEECAASGAALVYVPEVPGIRAWGVTQWLSAEKAILQMSLRGKTDDQFWFTFFHEAAHLLLHPKREIYVEGGDNKDGREEEADRFARDLLIGPAEWRRVAAAPPRSRMQTIRRASELGVSPGILTGRMQHEGLLPWTHMNDLKTRVEIGQRE